MAKKKKKEIQDRVTKTGLFYEINSKPTNLEYVQNLNIKIHFKDILETLIFGHYAIQLFRMYKIISPQPITKVPGKVLLPQQIKEHN